MFSYFIIVPYISTPPKIFVLGRVTKRIHYIKIGVIQSIKFGVDYKNNYCLTPREIKYD